MAAQAPRHLIAYFSLGGSTRQVAQWVRDELAALDHQAALHDVTLPEDRKKAPPFPPGEADCLWVLSPVYAQHPAPPVLDFLEGLADKPGGLAVPMATYGVVCSGVALADMGSILDQKGYRLAGAAKVVCQHSMLFNEAEPLGKGRPNAEDQEQVKGLVRWVAQAAADSSSLDLLSPADLNYQSEQIREAAAQRTIHDLRGMFPPMAVDEDLCVQCGTCAESCFTGNITMDPGPIHGDQCLYCLNCIKVCPNEAVSNPILGRMGEVLRGRAAELDEPAETKVF